jgi:hypothetical protein
VTTLLAFLMTASTFLWPQISSAETQAEEHHSQAEHHANEVGVFVGATHEHGENSAAMGLEYERRISSTFGIGVLAEKTWSDFDIWVYAVPITFHVDRWKFAIAPGIEESHGHHENLARLSVGYAFEKKKMMITPTLNIDFVAGEKIYVLGATFSKGF